MPEAGGPRFFLSDSFVTTKAALEALLPELDDTDAEVATVIAAIVSDANFTELAPVTDESVVKFSEEAEDIVPLHKLFRSEDVVTMRGVEEISFQYARRAVDDIAKMLETAAVTDTAAAAAQAGKSVLKFGSAPATNQYRHLLGVMRNENDLATVVIFCKVRVIGEFELNWGHSVTKIPSKFKVFAHDGSDFDEDEDILWVHELTAAKTG